MNQETKAKGISLIVLVITIIIIIILAGAVILSLNNSGIISKAKIAKESNDLTAIREAVEAEKSNGMFEGATASYSSIVPASYANDIEVLSTGTIILKYNASTKLTDLANAVDKLGAVYIPNGFVASTIAGEMSKEDGLVIYQGNNGNPDQTTVNAYVWVPVPNISQFYLVNQSSFATGLFTETTDSDEKSLIAEPEGTLMKASVEKYKGFYIARYEASGDSTPKSIKNSNTAGSITWTSSQTKARAVMPAIVNGTETPKGSPVSTLIYGEQWDATMRYMKDVPNISNPSNKYITDSTGMGGYSVVDEMGDPLPGSQTSFGTTAYSTAYKVKNIYDMAGNDWEWTMESYGSYNAMLRGGSYQQLWGYNGPASYRHSDDPTSEVYDYIGFRVALYIK